MENTRALRPSYFLVIAIIALLAVLVGFFKTFIVPLSAGTYSARMIVHLHAAFAFSWILLFIIQTSLAHFNKYHVHMKLGIAGVVIALGTAITMVFVGVNQVQREVGQGRGDSAISEIVGVVTSAILFLSLVTAAILNRGNGPAHKRLMLLATLVVIWPAWFRFRHYFPSIDRPDIWFALVLADIWILISIVWDQWRNGRIHPVFKYVGLFIILENTFEVMTFDSPTWRIVAKSIYNFLT